MNLRLIMISNINRSNRPAIAPITFDEVCILIWRIMMCVRTTPFNKYDYDTCYVYFLNKVITVVYFMKSNIFMDISSIFLFFECLDSIDEVICEFCCRCILGFCCKYNFSFCNCSYIEGFVKDSLSIRISDMCHHLSHSANK